MGMILALTNENPNGYKRMGTILFIDATENEPAKIGQKYYIYINSTDNFKGEQDIKEKTDFPIVTIDLVEEMTIIQAKEDMDTEAEQKINDYILTLNTPL